MALTYAEFDDDCDIPSGPLDWREMLLGFLLCAAIGIALAYLSLASVWVIIILALLSLPFIFKSVNEVSLRSSECQRNTKT